MRCEDSFEVLYHVRCFLKNDMFEKNDKGLKKYYFMIRIGVWVRVRPPVIISTVLLSVVVNHSQKMQRISMQRLPVKNALLSEQCLKLITLRVESFSMKSVILTINCGEKEQRLLVRKHALEWKTFENNKLDGATSLKYH